MVAIVGNQSTPQGGNQMDSIKGVSPSNTGPQIYMMESDVNIQTRAKNYDITRNKSKGKEPLASSSSPLQIERPSSEKVLHPLKVAINHMTHNPNAQAS